uniref:Uncharacterized protein n=1 Tax=Caenorhabditis japonica TaxID=281687 RepID=A0A8R1ENY5_CAEJA
MSNTKPINDVEIKVGDKIWTLEGKRNKIGHQFNGPFKVIEVQEKNITFVLNGPTTRSNTEKTRTLHKNRCKVYKEEEKE